MDDSLIGGSTLSLRLALGTLLLAYWIYIYIQKRLECEV